MVAVRALVTASVAVFGLTASAHGALQSEVVADGLSTPVFVTHAPGDSERLFIVELPGRVLIHTEAQGVLAAPFLDIADQVASGGERGLFSIAFHPDYQSNGLFYVHYTDNGGDTVVERYSVSEDPNVADETSGTVFFTAEQPFSNHNGGMMAFRAQDDGNYLYVGLGDGGSGGDPGDRAQDRSTPLGSILRIDVDEGAPAAAPVSNPFVNAPGDDLIWAYGLRNPWRFSFDRATGDLFIGDVGQSSVEEIDFEPAESAGGVNYGWRLLEGSADFNCTNCDEARETTTLPIHEYSHTVGRSVTGGYVYRGDAIPYLQGHYFFADYAEQRVWSFRHESGQVLNFEERTDALVPEGEASLGGVTSFGEDFNGELYMTTANGRVLKLADPAALPSETICITFADFQAEFEALANFIGADPRILDLDLDGIPDEFMLALFGRVLCYAQIDGHDDAVAAYQANIAALESAAQDVAPFRRALAAVLAFSASGQSEMLFQLAQGGLALDGPFQVVEEPVKVLGEPFTSEGDIDNDGFTNGLEYMHSQAWEGGAEDFALAASAPWWDAAEPLPVGSGAAGLLTGVLAALGVRRLRRRS